MCPSLMFAEDTGGSTAMNVKQGGPATSKRPQDYLLNNNFDKNKKMLYHTSFSWSYTRSPYAPIFPIPRERKSISKKFYNLILI